MDVVRVLFVVAAMLVASTSAVAPGDEEELCDDLRALGTVPTPDYDPTMVILMDTWNYQNLFPPRSGAVWQQVDNDTNNDVQFTTNWIQNSNSPCLQSVNVCGFAAGMQNNWLITQLINRTVNGTRLPQVSVIIEFEQRDCDVNLNCQRTFNTHVYERSTVDDDLARVISNYRQVQRVSPDDTTGNKVNETVNVDFSDDSLATAFYFAVQDETSCIIITRMIIFFHVCPGQIFDLIVHPQTTAPRFPSNNEAVALITVTTMCVENAVTDNGDFPLAFCSSGGLWSTPPGKGCQCKRGYANQDGGISCTACPAGTYASPSNDSCSLCPENSFSHSPGLAQCTCNQGFYRALTGEEDLPCREPPPPPTNVQALVITDDSIMLTWSPPSIAGTANLSYNVHTSFDNRDPVLATTVATTTATVDNLRSGTLYTVYVSVNNSFTDQIAPQTIAGSVMVTTGGNPPANSATLTTISVSVVVPVVIIIAVIIVLISLFLCWVYRRVNDDGGKELIAQYHDVTEMTQVTGRSMYVDPSIYASADDAVRDFAKEIPPKMLTIKEEIGRGEFGAVYRGTWRSGGKQVAIAIKTLKPNSSAKQRNDFLSEASIMGQFTHPNVVKLYGVVTKVEPVMIIMEFLENGSLFHYLRANDEKLGVQRLLKMAKGVATGMDYLSTIGFVHRDLAARNVLVSKNEICKVADFGLSRETVDDIYKVNKGGKIPVRWTAPEAIYRRKFTTSSDVWSYGVLFWEIMSYGQNPYDDMDNQELLDKLDDGYRLEKPDKTPDDVYQLMLECWNDDNIQRPTFAMIAQRVDELLTQLDDNIKVAPKKVPKTYSYSSSVVTSPLDYQTVDEWLDGLKMGMYKPNFERRGITTTNEVLGLGEEEIRKMDITLKGHISKMVRSIAIGNQKLGREPSMRI